MKYIISIPEPCDEKWDEMTPTEQGRFCDVCAKEIYDFTQISNRELVNKLKNNENICARYRKDQLDVDLFANSNTGLSRMSLLFSLTSLFAVSQPALAQDNSTINTEQQNKVTGKDSLQTKITPVFKTIKGIVRDNLGPIPGATVLVKHTQNGTVTDFDGNFDLVVDTSKAIVLIASYAGESREVIVSNYNEAIRIILPFEVNTVVGTRIIAKEHLIMGVITLKASDLIIKEKVLEKDKLVNINYPQEKPKKSIFTRIANLFRKKENRH